MLSTLLQTLYQILDLCCFLYLQLLYATLGLPLNLRHAGCIYVFYLFSKNRPYLTILLHDREDSFNTNADSHAGYLVPVWAQCCHKPVVASTSRHTAHVERLLYVAIVLVQQDSLIDHASVVI